MTNHDSADHSTTGARAALEGATPFSVGAIVWAAERAELAAQGRQAPPRPSLLDGLRLDGPWPPRMVEEGPPSGDPDGPSRAYAARGG